MAVVSDRVVMVDLDQVVTAVLDLLEILEADSTAVLLILVLDLLVEEDSEDNFFAKKYII